MSNKEIREVLLKRYGQRDGNYAYERFLKKDTGIINTLAYMCSGGDCVEKNEAQAVYFLSLSESLGCKQARANLASYLEKGTGIKKDEKRALELYEQADRGKPFLKIAFDAIRFLKEEQARRKQEAEMRQSAHATQAKPGRS